MNRHLPHGMDVRTDLTINVSHPIPVRKKSFGKNPVHAKKRTSDDSVLEKFLFSAGRPDNFVVRKEASTSSPRLCTVAMILNYLIG
jgi:hypothetical protein